jgi:glycosyltransferase involved in cell wall biosynthesis
MCKNVISDSFAIQAHYRRYFNRDTSFVPYGVPVLRPVAKEKQEAILQKYRLKPRRYFLQITRFEPDNLPLAIAGAFEKSGLWRNDFKLVLVGYKEATPYARQVKNLDGQHGIEVKDATYDPDELFVLRSNCFCYVHGNSVGGTNPALLEAMANCPRVMAIDGEFSSEVLGDTGLFFDPADIVSVFNVAVESEERAVEMQRRVQQRYQWDEVANSYMRLAEGEPAGYAVMAEAHPSGVTTSA